jgi:hypothetical protein
VWSSCLADSNSNDLWNVDNTAYGNMIPLSTSGVKLKSLGKRNVTEYFKNICN